MKIWTFTHSLINKHHPTTIGNNYIISSSSPIINSQKIIGVLSIKMPNLLLNWNTNNRSSNKRKSFSIKILPSWTPKKHCLRNFNINRKTTTKVWKIPNSNPSKNQEIIEKAKLSFPTNTHALTRTAIDVMTPRFLWTFI